MSLSMLIKRDVKLFFKDKGMFFSSLITPIILMVLYVSFLGKVYRDSFSSAIPATFNIAEGVINGTVGGQLMSSLLATCCITVAFCSNLIMVQDKYTGCVRDLYITPASRGEISFAYYIATFFNTLIVSFVATAAGFAYLASTGWYLSASDVLYILADVILLTMFGTALSSIVNVFLKTQGQCSAVGTIVSAGYGFLCGAYMPISNFGEGLQKVLMYLPGTYATGLIRNHCLAGVYREMETVNMPTEIIEAIKDSIDCNMYFYGDKVAIGTMYAVVGGSVVLLIALFVLISSLRSRSKSL